MIPAALPDSPADSPHHFPEAVATIATELIANEVKLRDVLRMTLPLAQRQGELLEQAKRIILGKGKYALFVSKTCKIDQRSANIYRQLYRGRDKIEAARSIGQVVDTITQGREVVKERTRAKKVVSNTTFPGTGKDATSEKAAAPGKGKKPATPPALPSNMDSQPAAAPGSVTVPDEASPEDIYLAEAGKAVHHLFDALEFDGKKASVLAGLRALRDEIDEAIKKAEAKV
jgi:hypothetical protein